MKERITDDEIRAYDNVPIDVAAQYLGVYPERLRNALKSGAMPFLGVAVTNAGAPGKTMFIISLGGLISWKNGTMPISSTGTAQ